MHSLVCDFYSSSQRFARGLVGSPHPASFRFHLAMDTLAFLPRKRSERLGKTDSAANNVSGGVCEAYVAVRKEPLNHDVRFYIQRYRHGIMVPQSYDVVAEKRSLNHVLRFYFQWNAHGILSPKETLP